MSRTTRIALLLLGLLLLLTCCARRESAAEPVHIDEVTESAEQTEAAETEETEPEQTEPEQTEPQETEPEETEQEQTEQEEAAEPEAVPALTEQADADADEADLPESGEYTSRDDVARYIYLYGHLPGNYITKNEAKQLGWVSSKGNLGEVAPGKSIGGDRFGNYEGLLPEAPGRRYTECDIDSTGSYRGAKRIIFSNDGLIYYTEDHYQSFELLYGEE